MRWYVRLTGLGLKKSYALKFLAVAFLGIHVPLIVLLVYLLGTNQLHDGTWMVALVVLLATLGGTAATLVIQYRLLEPIRRTEGALEAYRTKRTLPELPTNYSDEAGRLMSRVQTTLAQLDKMVTEKELLAASLAQDLRSPLSSIVSAVQLVEESEPNPDNRALLETIKETAARELAQIDDVLLAARIESDELELRKTLIGVSSILNEVKKQTQLTARQRGITLHIEMPVEQSYVSADRARIVQALNNLVLHALRSATANSAMGLRTKSTKTSCAFLLQFHGVLDDGGLGLRIADQLIKLHGGDLDVEIKNEETKISFSLSAS